MLFHVPCGSGNGPNDIKTIDVTIENSSHYYRYLRYGAWPAGDSEPTQLGAVAVSLGMPSGKYTLYRRQVAGFNYFVYGSRLAGDPPEIQDSNRLTSIAIAPTTSDCNCGGAQFSIQLGMAFTALLSKRISGQGAPPTEQQMLACDGCSGVGFASLRLDSKSASYPQCLSLPDGCFPGGLIDPTTFPIRSWIKWAAKNGCVLPIDVEYGYGYGITNFDSSFGYTTDIDYHRTVPGWYYIIDSNYAFKSGCKPCQEMYIAFAGNVGDTPKATFTISDITVEFYDGTTAKAYMDTVDSYCCSGRCSLGSSEICGDWYGDLLSLSISSCFGSGATATVAAPSGQPGTANGPINSATLTNGGSGYATYGRSSPTLTLTNSSAVPASVTVQLGEEKDACGRTIWTITGLNVTDGGRGYVNGQAATFSTAVGDVVELAVTATIEAVRSAEEPEITASASPGSGASFAVTLASNEDDPVTWGVSQVAVSGETAGYVDGDALEFSGAGVAFDSPAVATIRTGRLQPELAASVNSAFGTGATLSVAVSKTSDWISYDDPQPDAWLVSTVTIDGGGSGYAEYDEVVIEVNDGQVISSAYVIVSAVDQNGAITAIDVWNPGLYYKSDGIIARVVVEQPGAYYVDGVLTGFLDKPNGGVYYHPDKSLTPIVSDISVVLRQDFPSKGTGAAFSAVVDVNTASLTFGKITEIRVDQKGNGYLLRACNNPLP